MKVKHSFLNATIIVIAAPLIYPCTHFFKENKIIKVIKLKCLHVDWVILAEHEVYGFKFIRNSDQFCMLTANKESYFL